MGGGHLINIPKARTLSLNITLPNVLVCARLTLRSLLPHQRWAREIYILLASHKPLSQECRVWYGRVGKEIQGRLLTLNPNTKSPDTQPRALTTHALARAEMPVSPQHWQPSRQVFIPLKHVLLPQCFLLPTSFYPLPHAQIPADLSSITTDECAPSRISRHCRYTICIFFQQACLFCCLPLLCIPRVHFLFIAV